MNLTIVTPAPKGSLSGNRVTAKRWARLLRELGHRVVLTDHFDPIPHNRTDCLVALHARRVADSIRRCRAHIPGAAVVVTLTGTDLHQDLQLPGSIRYRIASKSLQTADRILLLAPDVSNALPSEFRDKSVVILQSARPLRRKPPPLKRTWEATLIGHLRKEKDPFLAARAVRDLPDESRWAIIHIGGALTDQMEKRALREVATNPRYRWLGPLGFGETQRRLARGRLTLLTSHLEGAANVIPEAIVNRVPILATRIPAMLGQLGDDYPGLFPVGDHRRLTELLHRFETESAFREELQRHLNPLRTSFSEQYEKQAWQRLLRSLPARQ